MDHLRGRTGRHLRPAVRGQVPCPAPPGPAAPGAGPARGRIMSDPAGTAIAVLAALGAAGSFGVAAALQHRQAQLAPKSADLSFRLLARLAGRPLWLAGIVLAAVAYGLQALALAFGPLALVAPIVATDLLFALPVAARYSRPLRAADWLGCALAAGGIAAFLAAAPPPSGRSDAPARDWLLAFASVALVCVLAVSAGRLANGPARAALTATAAGAVFGLTAAVTLSLTRLVRALGLTGLLLSANAFQAGALAASLPVMDTVEPACAVLLGTMLFGERLAASPAGFAVQLAGAAAAIAGITLLGRYAGTPAIRGAANQDHLVAGARAGRQGQPTSCADRQRPALEGRAGR